MTLACEDANSKLVDVVSVADDGCVVNNLLQIWKLRFGHKAFVQTLSTLVKILRLKFRRDFEAEVRSVVLTQYFAADVCLVNILKLGLVKIF